jgi:hypothetical protein
MKIFMVRVPAGTKELKVELKRGDGSDGWPDLYIEKGRTPRTSDDDANPQRLTNPEPGIYYVGVSYNYGFSGWELHSTLPLVEIGK